MPEPFASPLRSERFEVASRGDLVPGRWWRSAAVSGPCALVLIVPTLGAGKDAGEVEALAQAIATEGWAAAAIDLPLQGERSSAKLSARLAACAPQPPAEGAERLLWDEFLRQTALDLGATLDALGRRQPLDDRARRVRRIRTGGGGRGLGRAEPRVRLLLRTERAAAPADLVGRLRRALAAR